MRRVAGGGLGALIFILFALTPGAAAQSVLGRSPNLRGPWTLDQWQTAFVLNHRFEFLEGGDQLFNVPTLTLGISLPAGLALGLDFTSNSEIVHERRGENETQYWLGGGIGQGRRHGLEALVAYNSAARSMDGSLTGRTRLGSVSLLSELRGFSDVLGTGESGAAIAGGAVLHLTPYLELSADLAQMLQPDTLSSVWSAGVGVMIPGTPHTFSIHATNSGALTLQSASRPKAVGPKPVRYGFAFTVPLGSRAQWARIFRRGPPPAAAVTPSDTVAAAQSVDMRAVAFTPSEVRIRAGEAVAWINSDPLEHTVTSDDGTWGSRVLREGERYVRVFAQPGRYTYHCVPHPQMTGVVIVEAAP